MKSVPAILFQCLLAFALVTGGMPGWSLGDASAAADLAPQAISADTDEPADDSGPGCHGAGSEASPESAADTPGDDCCAEPHDDCTHDKCDCACPALTIVVPSRSAPVALAIAPGPASSLSAPAPKELITTLLRPPRA